ncbi:MAG: hypothetical protein HFJ48_05095 [Clostridia bacterium]|nr:hypothetical protein [Clostridia bacterium]
MFICNIKVNGNKLFKTILIVFGIVVLIITAFVFYRIFASNKVKVNDSIPHSDVTEISPNNYTNILKATHDDINSYIGKEIKFSGYVYRVLDFKENQFVLARNMLIDSQAYVVGFLCEYDGISGFEDGSWVEITGSVTKGKYHNQDIPIIKILSLNTIIPPENPYVSPPDNSYVPTSSML